MSLWKGTKIGWRFSICHIVIHIRDTERFDGRPAHADTQKTQEKESQNNCGRT